MYETKELKFEVVFEKLQRTLYIGLSAHIKPKAIVHLKDIPRHKFLFLWLFNQSATLAYWFTIQTILFLKIMKYIIVYVFNIFSTNLIV
jgi:hypothetical protein